MIRALTAILAVSALLAGCGSSTTAPISPSSRIEHLAGSRASRVVLTVLGAQRIGIQTATVRRGRNDIVVIPYAAVIYDPGGATFAFVSAGPLTYAEVPIRIDHIKGETAYLAAGPHGGAQVVTTGAEELYGVQTGVLAQT